MVNLMALSILLRATQPNLFFVRTVLSDEHPPCSQQYFAAHRLMHVRPSTLRLGFQSIKSSYHVTLGAALGTPVRSFGRPRPDFYAFVAAPLAINKSLAARSTEHT